MSGPGAGREADAVTQGEDGMGRRRTARPAVPGARRAGTGAADGGGAADAFARLEAVLRTRPEAPAVLGATRSGRPKVLARRGEIADRTDRLALALAARGLRAGDTVGVALRPGPGALALMVAAHRLGVCVAVLDPGAGPDVLRARLALARPSLVLADAAAQAAAGWAGPLARRRGLALPDLADIAPVATVGRWLPGCAQPLAVSGVGPAAVRRFEGDGDAVVVFTSGTTAAPRAVVHGRAGLAAGMAAVTRMVRPEPGLAVLGGTFFVLLPSLASGAPVALPARAPHRLARQLEVLRPQLTYLTPPQLRAALGSGASMCGRVWTGSAPASGQLLSRVKAAGAAEAWGVYALTELFPAAAVEQAEKAAFTGDGDLVGAPVPGVAAAVEDGELLLSGPAARDRYLGEDPDPWVRTGDRARLEGGRIVLAGRCKDMVLRGVENVYPGLYEPALHVGPVELAVLVGVDAGDGDQELVAVVQPRPGAGAGAVRSALAGPLRRMGAARPDAVMIARVPLSGRSRKPDRAAASRLAADWLRTGRPPRG